MSTYTRLLFLRKFTFLVLDWFKIQTNYIEHKYHHQNYSIVRFFFFIIDDLPKSEDPPSTIMVVVITPGIQVPAEINFLKLRQKYLFYIKLYFIKATKIFYIGAQN